MDAQIYENFSVDWTVLSYRTAKEDVEAQPEPEAAEVAQEPETAEAQPEAAEVARKPETAEIQPEPEIAEMQPEAVAEAEPVPEDAYTEMNAAPEEKKDPVERSVFVNGELIVMHGKPEYVFIDVFDYIDFDLSDSRGRAIITKVNDKNAFYTQTLDEGDEIVIRWEES